MFSGDSKGTIIVWNTFEYKTKKKKSANLGRAIFWTNEFLLEIMEDFTKNFFGIV